MNKRIISVEANNQDFPRAVLFASQGTSHSQLEFPGGNASKPSPVSPIPSQQPVDCVIKVFFYIFPQHVIFSLFTEFYFPFSLTLHILNLQDCAVGNSTIALEVLEDKAQKPFSSEGLQADVKPLKKRRWNGSNGSDQMKVYHFKTRSIVPIQCFFKFSYFPTFFSKNCEGKQLSEIKDVKQCIAKFPVVDTPIVINANTDIYPNSNPGQFSNH